MKVLVLLNACALVSCPIAAAAEPAPASERVYYSDLDLRTHTGQARLELRIHAAAARLCTDDNRASPTGYIVTKCYNNAVRDALGQAQLAVARAQNTVADASDSIAIARP